MPGSGFPHFTIPGIVDSDMKNPLNFYYFAMIVLGLCVFLMWYLTQTPFGKSLWPFGIIRGGFPISG